MYRIALPLLGLFLSLGMSRAQDALLSPADFLKHPYGGQFTPHHQVVDYVEYIARESERVELLTYGYTHEGRPLLLAFISSPANLARLEEIRQNHLRQAGFLDGAAINESPVAIVWLSFGVHGNEAGATESSMGVLHALADPGHPETGNYLENTLVILDPAVNPDGNNRYTNWYRQVAPLEADPLEFTREHQEPWPGGRENHYLFDLNRDWAWGTQSETRDRLEQYQRWLPHIHVDYHEQMPNDPYYFAPGAEPYHPAITQWQRDFQVEIGKNNASYFDREGWLYFTREYFDLFYPGYGDTYPTFAGAIGMTYEQAGHGRSGRAIELENGDTLTLADRIDHHTTTALSTVEIASRNAQGLVRQFVEFYDRSRNNPPGPFKSFVIRASNPPDQLRAFTRFLDMHQIAYGKAGKRRSLEAYDYLTGATYTTAISDEDLVVSAYQPAGALAQVLLEPVASLSDSLTYDITAWSAILAYGFDALALATRLEPEAPWQPLPYQKGNWPEQAPYAFLLPWTSVEDARFLGSLLREGIVVRVATKPFRIDGRDYERGTLVITRADNRKWEGFHRQVKSLAEAGERNLVAIGSGFVETGFDFGSESMRLLRSPKIALIAPAGADPDAFGSAWYYFEQVLQYPVSILDASGFHPSKLEGMDLLILPDGYYSWDENIRSRLADWLRSGGKVIAIGRALDWLQYVGGVHLTVADTTPKVEKPEEKIPERYEERERNALSKQIPGAIFKAVVDNSHPIGFGIPDSYFTLKRGARAFSYLDKAGNVAYLEEEPFSLGFVGSEAKLKVKKTLVLGAEPIGKGSAVYFVDDPLFRGFWHSGHLLFANAVFFGGL